MKPENFVGEYEPEHYLLKADESMAVGPYAVSCYGMEAKRAQAQGMINAKQVILDVAAEYEKISGRKYGFFEAYCLDDADYAIVAIGSACGTIKDAIDRLRAKGIRAGLLKVRVFRPFPGAELAEALKNCKSIAIMDRCESYSAVGGPLGAEVSAALFQAKSKAEVIKIVYGLNGRDFTVKEAEKLYEDLADAAVNGNQSEEEYRYIGLRE